ncbi:MAG: peptide deformylase [Nitrospinales bacterium]
MAELKIAKLGNPILRQNAQPVDLEELTGSGNQEIQAFIDDLIEIMRIEDGVGIAAPQVSRSIQIVIVEYAGNERYPGKPDIQLMVLVNPKITRYSKEMDEGWEGCLSLSNLRGLVQRSKEVTVEAYNRDGQKTVIEAEGFLAVVLQHEIDHLNGKVFLDRMNDMTKLCFQDEYSKYWVDEEEVEV